MIHRFILAVLLCVLGWAPVAAAKLKVVSSTPDLGSIAAYVGGDQVEVKSIARGNSDPHRVEVLPSYMVRVSKAKVFLKVGLSMDLWADPIVDGSRNATLLVVDCSEGIAPLEVPTGRIDARQGDVHPNGNPHYWLDPRNAAHVAETIASSLALVDPEHGDLYEANAARFARDAEALLAEGMATLEGLQQRTIVSYHTSWVYLAKAFGLTVGVTVEPVPGIPPTGKHLQALVDTIREQQLRVLLQEPYFSTEASQFLGRETGIRAITASPSCDEPDAGSYFAHMRALFTAIAAADADGES